MAKKSSTKLGLRSAPVSPSYDDMRWRAKDALGTLTRADEIRKDRALMKAVKAEARQQIKATSNVINGGAKKK